MVHKVLLEPLGAPWRAVVEGLQVAFQTPSLSIPGQSSFPVMLGVHLRPGPGRCQEEAPGRAGSERTRAVLVPCALCVCLERELGAEAEAGVGLHWVPSSCSGALVPASHGGQALEFRGLRTLPRTERPPAGPISGTHSEIIC